MIDNKNWNQEHSYRSNRVQLERMLNTIEEMIKKNGGNCYTNDVWQTVARHVQAERRQMGGAMEGDQSSNQPAKKRLLQSIMTELAGKTTGAFLGYLFGLAVNTLLSCSAAENLILGTSSVIGGMIGFEAGQSSETVSETVTKAAISVSHAAKDAMAAIKNIHLEKQ